MNLKVKFKKSYGITLIALVVSIIVLLILAGISISMLTGQNGILNRAQEAKEKTETSNQDERRKLAQAEALMSTGKTTYKGIAMFKGFAPTKIAGEDTINEGLVMTDGKGNEYVWVEVPQNEKVYKTAGLNILEFNDDAYSKIEQDLQNYTSDYRDGTKYKDEYVKDTENDGWFTEAEYNATKRKMLKSVYTNGGFWVGRYEAGYEVDESKGESVRNYIGDNASEHPINEKVVTKANAYPYNWLTRTQAKILAENVESGDYTSSLLFGVQWDLILKFFETKKVATQAELKVDSTNIGNYCENMWNVTNSSAKYSFNRVDFVNCPYRKSKSEGVLLTTGADKGFSLLNIYDIAGNVWEWTNEYTNTMAAPCAYRGGSHSYNNQNRNAANYRDNTSLTDTGGNLGFRVTLY